MSRMSRAKRARMQAMIVLGVLILVVVIALAAGIVAIVKNAGKSDKVSSEPAANEQIAEQEQIAESEPEVLPDTVEEFEYTAGEDELAAEEMTEETIETVEAENTEENAEETVVEESVEEEIVANDKVRIRSNPSTDSEVLGTAVMGDRFIRISEADGWSQIKYKDSQAYIKSDYVEPYTGQTFETAKAEEAEKNNKVEANTNQNTTDEAAKKAAEEAAKKAEQEAAQKAAEEAAKKAADEAAKKAEQEAAQAAAPAAPAPAAGGSHVVYTSDGASLTVNDRQYQVFVKYWGYLGNVDETVSHHTKGDLITLLQMEGVY